jgi:hypothetical protein
VGRWRVETSPAQMQSLWEGGGGVLKPQQHRYSLCGRGRWRVTMTTIIIALNNSKFGQWT